MFDADAAVNALIVGRMSTGPAGGRVAARSELRQRGSRRLLRRSADERLVALLGRGHELAFEELFDRHSEGVLSYCSHILGSENDGQDAVQHAFLAVWQAVVERGVEPRAFNSWLYAIARNRCLSVLRSRREATLEWEEENVPAREGTVERVEQRAEVRELLGDLRTLPEGQRTALLLAELGDLSHVEIASVLGCPHEKVKSLVFQARSSLVRRSESRQTPCLEVREELAGLAQSRLPLALRRHLKGCGGCAEFATELRRQRRLIAIALPVAVCGPEGQCLRRGWRRWSGRSRQRRAGGRPRDEGRVDLWRRRWKRWGRGGRLDSRPGDQRGPRHGSWRRARGCDLGRLWRRHGKAGSRAESR